MWFKYSGGGLKDIKVSLCGLLYSKKTGQDEQVWSRWEIEWNTWLQANKQSHGSTHTHTHFSK